MQKPGHEVEMFIKLKVGSIKRLEMAETRQIRC